MLLGDEVIASALLNRIQWMSCRPYPQCELPNEVVPNDARYRST